LFNRSYNQHVELMSNILCLITPRKKMTEYLLDVADGEEVRQGDLIHCPESSEWGFILTADCDIAQGKLGRCYSFVEVVPASQYLEEIWAPDQIVKLQDKQARVASEQIAAVMKRSDLPLSMTSAVLLAWLRDQAPTEIEAATNKSGRPFDQSLIDKLKALHVTADATITKPSFERLCEAKRLLGEDGDRIRKAVRDAFQGDRGFPDYFLLPELPGVAGYGFVVMLRAIRSVAVDDLYPSLLDARIEGRNDAFYRVGRMSDGIRFAITQKLTFLFSRIGLPTSYEKECRSAVELLAETAISGGAKNEY
jgi:hypothetical protein